MPPKEQAASAQAATQQNVFIKNLQDQIDKLQRDLDQLSKTFFHNNFGTSQDFNKSSAFNTSLKVPHYASAPNTNIVGQIIEIGGKLYISTAVNTWTIVGTQVA